jgi:hypothetical protein
MAVEELDAVIAEATTNGSSLVVAEGGALTSEQFDEAKRLLAEWQQDGDSDALSQARAQAATAAQYARRSGFRAAANQYSSLTILCEASIGQIDRRLTPSIPMPAPPLELGDIRVNGGTRRAWRVLGVVAERGLLEGLLDRLDDVTFEHARKAASREGLAWAPAKPLRDHIKAQEVTYAEIARRYGVRRDNLYRCLHVERVHWATALRVCEIVGFDPFALPPAPRPAQPTRDAARKRERKLERQEAEAALARERERRAIKSALKVAKGKAVSELYVMVERMQDVIAQAQHETEDREARAALSRMGALQRQAHDEVVRALGVS